MVRYSSLILTMTIFSLSGRARPPLHEFFSSGLKDHERCYVPDHELLILHHQMRVEILIRIPFLERNMSSGIRSSTGTTFAGLRDNSNLRLKRKVKQSVILINNTLDSTRRGIEACLRPLRQQSFQLVLSHRNFVLPGNKRFYQSVWSWLEVPDSKLHSHLIKDSWTSNGDRKNLDSQCLPR